MSRALRSASSRSATTPFKMASLNLRVGTSSRSPSRVTLVLYPFFPPRDFDMADPTTRFVVGNINAFHHHSTELNTPHVDEDMEAMFCFTGAKNVRCFSGHAVGGVVTYGISYAVVDFDTVEDAIAVFGMLQGRKDHADSFRLRLKFVDRKGKTFGIIFSRAMAMKRDEGNWFADFVEDMAGVDVDLTNVRGPRPGFALPPRPVSSVQCSSAAYSVVLPDY